MSEFLGPLLTEKEQIASASTLRKKKVIEKTIQAKDTKLLDEKLAVEEKDGWKLVRKNKTSYRIATDKRFDEQLEDEVWSTLAQMQFKEMSDGRNFKIQTDKDVEPRQIDVFAKDDEVAIFVECTQRDTPGLKRMAPLIEKIESFREKISKSLISHYGRTPKLKQGWVIATRNIEWTPADLDKAKAVRITVLRDTELDYYVKYTRMYKLAAKYQLLAHLFAKEPILGLDLAVPATKGSMGGVDFYNFLINPLELLKISHVSHKASKDIQDIDTYQRLLQPKRLKELAEYIDAGGQFPTNIVVNMRTKRKMRFDKIDDVGNTSFGTLYLPNQYASAYVIDGQHRLYGYAYSERVEDCKKIKATVPVLAYENLAPTKEAKLFVDINCEQVRVPRNLLNEINATLYWDSEDFDMQIDALCSRITMTLNSKQISPIFDRVKMTNKDQTYKRCLTLTNFIDSLKENRFFGEKRPSGFIPGPLSDSSTSDLEKTLTKSVDVIEGYLNFFAKSLPYHWDLGNIKKEKDSQVGFLATNEGIRTLLRVLKELFTHIHRESGVALDVLDSQDVLARLEVLTKPITDVFKTATCDIISHFRSRSGQKGIRQNFMVMLSFINKQIPAFNPPGLEEYMESVDEDGTRDAKMLIGELQKRLHKFVLYRLKEIFPDGESWWYEGVPDSVRRECMTRREDEKGAKEKEQYMTTINYHAIAYKNWKDGFDKAFSFTKDGGKDKQLGWIQELSKIRNITHHEEKWPATKEQVAFVRDIHKKVFERLIIPE
jgi:DNA sulfur modification protein DndB